MNLTTINTENIAAIPSNEHLTLDEITKDNVSLETHSSVQPVQNPIRRIPHALMGSILSRSLIPSES